ncbi:MAG: hypothetical protein ACTHO8_11900 [Solirubrobacterales bacterium]
MTGHDARVYRLKIEGGESMVFGCVPGSRPQRLDFPREANTPWEGRSKPWVGVEGKSIALHAPWVGYLENFVNVDVGDMNVAALNLRTGRFRHCDIGRWSSAAGTYFWMAGITVTKKGSVGWIGERQGSPEFHEMVAACEGSKVRHLDSDEGEAIDLHSLRLHEPRLLWLHSGAIRSARIR